MTGFSREQPRENFPKTDWAGRSNTAEQNPVFANVGANWSDGENNLHFFPPFIFQGIFKEESGKQDNGEQPGNKILSMLCGSHDYHVNREGRFRDEPSGYLYHSYVSSANNKFYGFQPKRGVGWIIRHAVHKDRIALVYSDLPIVSINPLAQSGLLHSQGSLHDVRLAIYSPPREDGDEEHANAGAVANHFSARQEWGASLFLIGVGFIVPGAKVLDRNHFWSLWGWLLSSVGVVSGFIGLSLLLSTGCYGC
ncbi:MAG: hypothetical protein ABSD98_06335 [Candidatus Korobacteraceae bacterium]